MFRKRLFRFPIKLRKIVIFPNLVNVISDQKSGMLHQNTLLLSYSFYPILFTQRYLFGPIHLIVFLLFSLLQCYIFHNLSYFADCRTFIETKQPFSWVNNVQSSTMHLITTFAFVACWLFNCCAIKIKYLALHLLSINFEQSL